MEQTNLLIWLGYAVQILFLMLGAYYFLISLFSFIPRKQKKPENITYYDYALVVAAHNEEQVIGNMVESLTRLNYPKDRYQIFVIADNCTDSTARCAAEAGATVMERTDTERRGKGYALEWMFEKLYHNERRFDNVVIFDADNLVDPDFLQHINNEHNCGHQVVQGYIDSKNPYDSWISASYSIGFWMVNRLFQLSRHNLGLGCQLCGTGFSMSLAVLEEIGWGATCLTEDMEFTMKLSLNNIRVAYAKDARVYDEKPLTMSQSWKQRVRWMQGHADVASRFCVSLFKKAFSEKKFAPADCALYLLQPLRILTMGIITLMGWVQTAYPESNLIVWGYVPPAIWTVFTIAQFCWTPLVLIVEKRFRLKTIYYYVGYLVYTLTWVPIAIIGIAKKNQKEWFHTQHTRTISISEMNK